MTSPPHDAPAAPKQTCKQTGRLIGAHRGEREGPLLLCISSLHGNEPSGITALRHILLDLARSSTPIRGDFVGLRGNLAALENGRRFLDEDLNRVWQTDRVGAILQSLRAEDRSPEASDRDVGTELPMVGSVELAEQRGLLCAIRAEAKAARGPIFVLDLHTTSAESAPFSTLGDTLQNRALALELPIPVVLGLEEQIDGAMLQYFDHLGWQSIGIEGGSHTSPASIDAHEDCVWLLLAALGLIDSANIEDLPSRRARLAASTRGLPRVVDVRVRREISARDEFRMKPGFQNFDRVRVWDELGTDRKGLVRASQTGRIFLPLYQEQGDDGYFIVRRVHPFWLRISRTFRSAGADRLAPWLPGVQAHPDRTDAVVLSPIARNRLVVGLLHLLGFNARYGGARHVMIRRVEAPLLHPDLDLRV